MTHLEGEVTLREHPRRSDGGVDDARATQDHADAGSGPGVQRPATSAAKGAITPGSTTTRSGRHRQDRASSGRPSSPTPSASTWWADSAANGDQHRVEWPSVLAYAIGLELACNRRGDSHEDWVVLGLDLGRGVLGKVRV